MISDFQTGFLSMDPITMQYQAPLPRQTDALVVLDVDDVELIEESLHAGGSVHGFPPAISDWELSQLVDECTSELCQLEAYRYGAYIG